MFATIIIARAIAQRLMTQSHAALDTNAAATTDRADQT